MASERKQSYSVTVEVQPQRGVEFGNAFFLFPRLKILGTFLFKICVLNAFYVPRLKLTDRHRATKNETAS